MSAFSNSDFMSLTFLNKVVAWRWTRPRRWRAARGDRREVAVFGEMVALPRADGRADATLRLERLWNKLARNESLTLQCAYPTSFCARASDELSIGLICTELSHVVATETSTALAIDEERLRAIAFLQQKAVALRSEIAARRQTQATLQR